ncbi:MAG: ROK family transcriptional regulator [Rhodobacteraceae bacterium]|nr:ROK family transcriptional regulator [Paracoccaceae bacterium]
MLQRNGAMAGGDLARMAGLSSQTVSVIFRQLENEGLLQKGMPVRGKVGKPSVPMDLAAHGVLSFGLKIGRRSADLLLLDFKGSILQQLHTTFAYPMPDEVFGFLKEGLGTITAQLPANLRRRICGLGVATPFELWRWHDLKSVAADKFKSWKDIDMNREVAAFTELPVYVLNDATAACKAEHIYGRGREFQDYAYFFIGAFIGGGVVLNDTVFEGNQGNAGALGSIRSTGPLGESRQLVDVASIYQLEGRLTEAGLDPRLLWSDLSDWTAFERFVEPWIGETAQELAKASLSICSVIDFGSILIDGAFPPVVREALVKRTRRYLATQDTRGLIPPVIEAGSIGPNARAVGAACSPIFAQYMLNMNTGLSPVGPPAPAGRPGS